MSLFCKPLNFIRLLTVFSLLVIMSQCSVPRNIDSYETANGLAKSNAYQKALKDYQKKGLVHICLSPMWDSRKVWCSECFFQLDSTFIELGITPRYRAINRDYKSYNYEALFWSEYQNIMDSLILAKHGPDFLDSLCATVTIPEKE